MRFRNGGYSGAEMLVLAMLRFAVGWHLLYEGIVKITDPGWTSANFLRESKWILSGFSEWILSDDGILHAVDLLNSWGLTAIGAGLVLGLFTRVVSLSGAFLLLLYYLNSPPLTGLVYSVTADGNNLIVNRTLIEAICLVLLAVFPSGRFLGMDSLFSRKKATVMEVS
ncbi:MAG TPA: DoxX subfamily [Bacteroides sp.]|nr:DoxX subfamily [Bacteroides sp.]